MGAEGPGTRKEAAEALSRALDILLELGLEDEARDVSSLISRLDSLGVSQVRPQVFRREGEYWFVMFEGDVFRLKDSKGLRYLATLLGSPGREIHSLHLVGSGAFPAGDAGEVLDSEARRAYRRRLHDLREELEEAQGWADTQRAARARQEMDALVEELARGEGMGGRAKVSEYDDSLTMRNARSLRTASSGPSSRDAARSHRASSWKRITLVVPPRPVARNSGILRPTASNNFSIASCRSGS
jgi:hypothetical protein